MHESHWNQDPVGVGVVHITKNRSWPCRLVKKQRSTQNSGSIWKSRPLFSSLAPYCWTFLVQLLRQNKQNILAPPPLGQTICGSLLLTNGSFKQQEVGASVLTAVCLRWQYYSYLLCLTQYTANSRKKKQKQTPFKTKKKHEHLAHTL